MGLKILNISGGGTKIFGEAAIVKALYEEGLNPDIITGVSAGSYLAVPIAMRMFNEIDQMQQHLNLDTMFDPAPVNNKGKITIGAAWRVIKGSYWLGDQTKSLDLLRAVITPELFEQYKTGNVTDKRYLNKSLYSDLAYYPEVYLLSVDFRSGANNLVRVRDLTYDQYLAQTLASGSIPVFTKGVEEQKYQYDDKLNRYLKNGNALLFDGGIRNHIASTVTIEDLISGGYKIDEVVSVYARPKDYDISKPFDWMPADISTSITRTIDIMEMQLSKGDEVLEKSYAKMHNFKLTQLFLPSDMLNGTYDVDQTRLKAFYNACYVIGKEKPTEYTFKTV